MLRVGIKGVHRWRILGPTIACMIACQEDSVEIERPTRDEIEAIEREICTLSLTCIYDDPDDAKIAMCTASSVDYVEELDSVCLYAYFPWRTCVVDTKTNCDQYELGAYRVLCDDEQRHAEDHCPEGTHGL